MISKFLRDKLEENPESISDAPNNVKLELYALGKQGSIGDINEPRPGFTDPKGRFKWDAWLLQKG